MINHFLSNSVVSASIVVSGIFFASHQLVWVKQLSVFAAANLVWNKKKSNQCYLLYLLYIATIYPDSEIPILVLIFERGETWRWETLWTRLKSNVCCRILSAQYPICTANAPAGKPKKSEMSDYTHMYWTKRKMLRKFAHAKAQYMN